MFYRLIIILSIAFTSIAFANISAGISRLCELASQGCIILVFIKSLYLLASKKVRMTNNLKIWFLLLFLTLPFIPFYRCGNNSMVEDIRQVTIPFIITVSAYSLFNVDSNKLNRILIYLCVLTCICGISAIIISGGFEISSLYREGISKNQTAPYFAQFSIVSLVIALNSKNPKISILMYFIALILLTYPIVLRARAATLGAVFIELCVLYHRYRLRVMYVVLIFLVVIVSNYGEELRMLFELSIIGNTDINDIDSVTSGRVSRNGVSFNDWVDNFFLGTLNSDSFVGDKIVNGTYDIPHFYLLWTLVKYGIIGSLPFIIIYISNFVYAFKILKKKCAASMLMFACIGFSYIVSFAEYCAPFGPGSSFILTYTLFGYTIRKYSEMLKRKPKVFNNIIPANTV